MAAKGTSEMIEMKKWTNNKQTMGNKQEEKGNVWKKPQTLSFISTPTIFFKTTQEKWNKASVSDFKNKSHVFVECVRTDLFPEQGRRQSWTCFPRRPSALSKPFPWCLQDCSDRRCELSFCWAATRLTSESLDQADYPENSLQRENKQSKV